MDPNLIVEALRLILSGETEHIKIGEKVIGQAKQSDSYIKSLMIIANSSEVIPSNISNFFVKNSQILIPKPNFSNLIIRSRHD